MPFTVTDITLGFLLPLIVATGILWCCRLRPRVCRPETAAAIAFVVAFQLGYWSLGLGPLWPKSHWHWLPWLLMVTLVFSVIPASAGKATGWRWVALLLLSLSAAWLLVPNWPTLPHSAMVLRTVLFTGVIIDSGAMFRLSGNDRLAEPMTFVSLAIGSLAVPVVLIISGSLLLGQVGGCGAAATAGVAVAALMHPRLTPGAIGPALSVFFCGAMFVGYVNSFSRVPAWCYLAVALVPMAVAVCHSDALRKKSGTVRRVVAAVPILLTIAAVGTAAWAEFGSGGTEEW